MPCSEGGGANGVTSMLCITCWALSPRTRAVHAGLLIVCSGPGWSLQPYKLCCAVPHWGPRLVLQGGSCCPAMLSNVGTLKAFCYLLQVLSTAPFPCSGMGTPNQQLHRISPEHLKSQAPAQHPAAPAPASLGLSPCTLFGGTEVPASPTS